MKVGRCLFDVRNRHSVVKVLGVAAQSAFHGGTGQRGFDFHDGGSAPGCFVGGLADHDEYLLHVVHVALADGDHVRVVFDVVIAIGQGEASLVNAGDGHVGIVKISSGAK